MSGANTNVLAIVIGASIFENAPHLSSPAFRNAADRFLAYLVSPDGLALSENNILWLFDTSYAPNSVDLEIIKFLNEKITGEYTDLLIYYVGHGSTIDDQYYLAIRTTRPENQEVSSLQFRWLSKSIYHHAKSLRTLWIIEACYAGESKRYFLGDDDDVLKKQVIGLYTKTGVSILCSSPSTRKALLDKDSHLPVFTGYLLNRLEDGISSISSERITARQLHEQVRLDIVNGPDDAPPLPELHSPVQGGGQEVSSFPLFPNHKGKNNAARTEQEIAKIRQWGNNKIVELEKQYADEEEENQRRRRERNEEDIRRVSDNNSRLEQEKRKRIKDAEDEARLHLEEVQKRLAGWSQTEIDIFSIPIKNKCPTAVNISEWLRWHIARLNNFTARAKFLIGDLYKKQKEVWMPNQTYIDNMNRYRMDGQISLAGDMYNHILESKHVKKKLDKAVNKLESTIQKADMNLLYYNYLLKKPNLIEIIAREIKNSKTVPFEEWLGRSFIDKKENIVLEGASMKIHSWFMSKEKQPSEYSTANLEKMLTDSEVLSLL